MNQYELERLTSLQIQERVAAHARTAPARGRNNRRKAWRRTTS